VAEETTAISDLFHADYQTSLIVAGIDTLRERREALLTAKFLKRQVLASSSLFHSPLPSRRDNVTSSLRNA